MTRTLNLILIIIVTIGITSPALAQDPDADKILKSMSSYLGELPALIANADVDTEVLDLSGQKLQFSSSVTISAKRPAKLHVSRKGAIADIEIILNDKTLTLYGKGLNIYNQIENPGSIDDALDKLRDEIGLHAPGADLFYADPYVGLSSGVMNSTYLGTDYVNGVECHNLAFREAKTDWQLWVMVGDKPLPMKYVITTKWLAGAPQHSVRFRDWNTKPQIEASQFEFSVPDGALKIEAMHVNELGELIAEEVEK